MTGRHETDHRHGGRVKNPRVVVVVALGRVVVGVPVGVAGSQAISAAPPRTKLSWSAESEPLLSDTVAVMTGAMPPEKIPADCLA